MSLKAGFGVATQQMRLGSPRLGLPTCLGAHQQVLSQCDYGQPSSRTDISFAVMPLPPW